MNIREGLLRIAKVIRVTGIALAFIFLIALTKSDSFLIGLAVAVFLSVLTYSLAWIIEGFAQDK